MSANTSPHPRGPASVPPRKADPVTLGLTAAGARHPGVRHATRRRLCAAGDERQAEIASINATGARGGACCRQLRARLRSAGSGGENIARGELPSGMNWRCRFMGWLGVRSVVAVLAICSFAAQSRTQPLSPADWPTTVQETVRDILSNMSAEEKRKFTTLRERVSFNSI